VIEMSSPRQTYRDLRLKFWNARISPDAPFPENLLARLDPENPLPQWARDAVPEGRGTIRILDLNSGPLSAIGTKADDIEVHLTAVDDLAEEYNELLRAHEIVPPVSTRFCRPGGVLEAFGANTFDLIYTYNGLHFTDDPVRIYRQLLHCLSPDGKIIAFHDLPDDPDRFKREPARYFHGLLKDRVVIRRKVFQRDLEDALPGASIQGSFQNGLLRVEISKREALRPPAEINNLSHGEELPNIISMHLPKTGGSSFRQYLESIYGQSLRCLYSVEETDPLKVDSLELPPDTRCLHGHFQADAFDRQLPGALKISWLRDPVERVVSSYFQFQRSPESAGESDFNARVFREGWSLMDFARTEEMRDHVLWHFNAVPLDEFFFIGITERFDESLRLFCHLIGRPVPEGNLTQNVNPEKQVRQQYPLPEDQRRELEAVYAEEYELYRYAQYRLDLQLKRYGV